MNYPDAQRNKVLPSLTAYCGRAILLTCMFLTLRIAYYCARPDVHRAHER